MNATQIRTIDATLAAAGILYDADNELFYRGTDSVEPGELLIPARPMGLLLDG